MVKWVWVSPRWVQQQAKNVNVNLKVTIREVSEGKVSRSTVKDGE